MLTDIGAVNEAEEVQKRHCGHNVKIDLEPQPPLKGRIVLNKRMAISTGEWLVCCYRLFMCALGHRHLVMAPTHLSVAALPVSAANEPS